jgi:GR25 family glycosyltransferase involved in LPS biosynthesis
LASAWGFFDRIYCISLANRSDRQRQARAEFERVGLSDLVEFVIVDKHPDNSEQGIFESHTACLRAGLAGGAQNILIFEDDIIFRRFSRKILGRAIEFMRTDTDWSMFFFGCFVYSSRRTRFRSILRVRYQCTAHAYVVSRGFAEKLAEQPWQGIAYDDVLRSMTDEKAFAVYPAFAFQSGSSTDNDNLRGIDRIRRLLGGSRRLQRWNEFSRHHLAGLVVGHALFILVVIVAIVLIRGGHWLNHVPILPFHH